ncbi:hypothetical protein IMX07_10815 [bacterium]|nr:hypothetical protein [bacterium]
MELYPETKGWASMLAPEIMTAAQWADAYRSRARSGEQRLMLAVLEDAVSDLMGAPVREGGDSGERRNRRRMRRAADAERWIFGEPGDEAVRFEDCCDALEIDPDYLRLRLRRAMAAQAPRRAEIVRELSGVRKTGVPRAGIQPSPARARRFHHRIAARG